MTLKYTVFLRAHKYFLIGSTGTEACRSYSRGKPLQAGVSRTPLRLAKSRHTKLGFLRNLWRLAKFGLAGSRLRGSGLLAKIGHIGLSKSNLTL